jgi:hypothetical protein
MTLIAKICPPFQTCVPRCNVINFEIPLHYADEVLASKHPLAFVETIIEQLEDSPYKAWECIGVYEDDD